MAFVNNAAVRVQISLQEADLTSFGYILRSEVDRSYGNSILVFCGNSTLFFHSGCIFHVPTNSVWGASLSIASPALVFLLFFGNSPPSRCEGVAHCGFDLHFSGA